MTNTKYVEIIDCDTIHPSHINNNNNNLHYSFYKKYLYPALFLSGTILIIVAGIIWCVYKAQ